MEALTLTLTEVVKRQNPKSKKGFNQVKACFSHHPHTALAGVGYGLHAKVGLVL